MISENLTTFKGLKVLDWENDAETPDFKRLVYRVRVGYDEVHEGVGIADKLASLLDAKGSEQMQSLVIGSWHGDDPSRDSSELIELLVSARQRLPALRNLFIGDITSEENEISWIMQSDVSPLLGAYPNLEHLTVRGAGGLTFGRIAHERLRELIVQSGGLSPDVIHEITSAKLPSLEHLELWLGEPNYGGDATVEDLAPLLPGNLFPKLRYLGLKDSVIQDEIAGVMALAPVLNQLEVLDLSMGSLGDEGAKSLLASPLIRKLKMLDLHHHFMSKAVAEQFKRLGIEVDVSDQQSPSEWGGEQHRFIAVSE